jgi:glycosyltransferase involved in cell wall biosynthesis
MPGRVHQLLASLAPGDAIGNEALAIRGHLRAAGFDSEIYAESVDPRLSREARPLEAYLEASGPASVCLYHFAVGSAAGPLIHSLPDRLVLRYHNVTPARFFLGYQNHVMGLCHHGRRTLEAFAARAELALGVSEFNRRELAAAGFARSGVLPIVLDPAAYRGRRSPVVQRQYGDGRANVLFVGRVIPNKRHEELLAAFALFQRGRPRSRLLLVGDSAGCSHYHDRLRERARDLGLRDVVFSGHVEQDELLAYYSAADVFVCLSEHEGYCVPLIEAMLLGVPVIAFDAGAVRETLRGGGVLLTDKRPELVAELIESLVADPALRAAVLASQARALEQVLGVDHGALLLERLGPVLGRAA